MSSSSEMGVIIENPDFSETDTMSAATKSNKKKVRALFLSFRSMKKRSKTSRTFHAK